MTMFNENNGRTSEAEAKRYVYRILSRMLIQELHPDEHGGWMFGGIEEESDKRKLRRAIKIVIAEMDRKGG